MEVNIIKQLQQLFKSDKLSILDLSNTIFGHHKNNVNKDAKWGIAEWAATLFYIGREYAMLPEIQLTTVLFLHPCLYYSWDTLYILNIHSILNIWQLMCHHKPQLSVMTWHQTGHCSHGSKERIQGDKLYTLWHLLHIWLLCFAVIGCELSSR